MAVALQTFKEEDLHLSELDDLLDEIEEDQKEHERKTSEVQLPKEDDASSQSPAQPPNARMTAKTTQKSASPASSSAPLKKDPRQKQSQPQSSSSGVKVTKQAYIETVKPAHVHASASNTQKDVAIAVIPDEEDTKFVETAETAYDTHTPSTARSSSKYNKQELSFAHWIRNLWRVGSKLEVYSAVGNRWLIATVVRIFMSDDGEWIEVQSPCAQLDNTPNNNHNKRGVLRVRRTDMILRVKRDDSINVRPLRQAMAVYKYIYNAAVVAAAPAVASDVSLSELQILSKKYPKSEQQFLHQETAVSVAWPMRGIRVVEELLRYYECGTFQDIFFTNGQDIEWTQLALRYPTVTAMYVCQARKASNSLSGIEYARGVCVDDAFMSNVLSFLSTPAMKKRSFLGVQVVYPANDVDELEAIANRFEHSFQLIRYKILIHSDAYATETATVMQQKLAIGGVAFYIVHQSVHL